MIDLRPHQAAALGNIDQAIQAGSGQTRGRIVVPTGGGKTFIEAAAVRLVREKYRKAGIHLVMAPRIVLVNQLIRDYRKILGTEDFRCIAFHSGFWREEQDLDWDETSTTSLAEVRLHHGLASKFNRDLVVFSTFHSAWKFINEIEFDTIVSDESQYCMEETFFQVVRDLAGSVRLFFTATEKHTASAQGRGLNNEAIFGKRLFEIAPHKLVEQGLIVPPRLHVLWAETNVSGTKRKITNKEETKFILHEVMEIVDAQTQISSQTLGFSKILFAMKGTEHVKVISDNVAKVRARFPNHDVFLITSKLGAEINGVKVKRDQDFLPKLKDSKNALIFHYNILSEGIDVDGITGVAILRGMDQDKLLQTIGRAVRVYKPNPEAKRFALITVPVINGDQTDREEVFKIIQAIRQGGYDISAHEVSQTGETNHQPDPEQVEDAYGNDKSRGKLDFLTNIFNEYEDMQYFENLKQCKTVEGFLAAL